MTTLSTLRPIEDYPALRDRIREDFLSIRNMFPQSRSGILTSAGRNRAFEWFRGYIMGISAMGFKPPTHLLFLASARGVEKALDLDNKGNVRDNPPTTKGDE